MGGCGLGQTLKIIAALQHRNDAAGGAPIGDLPREKLFGQLFARPGTVVRLTIRHGGLTRDVTLTTR